MLEFAHQCLVPDGKLLVATGSRILVPFKKALSSYFSKNPADTHCFRYSRKSLGIVLSRTGFFLDEINRWKEDDWLVMVGVLQNWNLPSDRLFGLHDKASEVVDFFNRWDREFP